jgi:GT2 family glycosyltransferase
VRLSVVVSTLGNYDVLRRVLDGFARQTVPPETFELIVVADRADPDPGTIERAVGRRPYEVRQLTGTIPGLSSNRNVGWRAARAPIVLFTDNDTIPVENLVREHLASHTAHPDDKVAVVGHVRWAPELRVTPFMRWLEEGIQFDYPSISGTEASWAHLYGANSSLKRAYIERVGGFDEVRMPYLYDDLDFAYRAHKQGLRVVYNRRAIVDHLRPGMTLEFWKEKVKRVAAAERQFVTIHPELDPPLYGRFKSVAPGPGRGRSVKIARFVPESVPWLGPRVWSRVRQTFLQELAPHFLAGWEEAAKQPPSAEWLAASAEGGRAQRPGSAAGSERPSNPSGP